MHKRSKITLNKNLKRLKNWLGYLTSWFSNLVAPGLSSSVAASLSVPCLDLLPCAWSSISVDILHLDQSILLMRSLAPHPNSTQVLRVDPRVDVVTLVSLVHDWSLHLNYLLSCGWSHPLVELRCLILWSRFKNCHDRLNAIKFEFQFFRDTDSRFIIF